ncbi:hypothetical protein [Streptomyces halobius]|uniref:Uncharacterized protein n=1 Tax=Streptomyces halobius TaxID=2879846 RepID=A0ABY4MCU6_9ACTN|nr:hypothetical protein [Streptomyces halobius]UQA94918.1 hypothetical protein K9S39_26435 [Streptomyces halobius]
MPDEQAHEAPQGRGLWVGIGGPVGVGKSAQVNATSETETSTAAAEEEIQQIPATEVKPEDIGSLSLRYVDGVPQLVVSGGTGIPADLTVVDASGSAVATYAAGPPPSVSHAAVQAREAAVHYAHEARPR